MANSMVNILIKKYPNGKFNLYDYRYSHPERSLPISLNLFNKNMLDEDGLKIGITYDTEKASPTFIGRVNGLQLVNLSSSSSAQLIKSGWVSVNPKAVYNSVENWYVNKK